MNLQNLDRNELLALQQLINKALDQPKEKDVDDMIKEIMDEFDFDRVETVMDALDWKWRGETPTIEDLKDEAERLLRGAAESRLGAFKNEHHGVAIINACGGFEARAFCNEDKTKITGLDLAFVVESWDSSIEE
jgi:uncharacterized ferredoxin-like protein